MTGKFIHVLCRICTLLIDTSLETLSSPLRSQFSSSPLTPASCTTVPPLLAARARSFSNDRPCPICLHRRPY
ncbi:hypothetical protein PF002_g13935 [Phytophthora fragariae]|uniref:Secreted protein n=1 Tax=Phytophthora fragariae TaxID=53985 RepID=A0A6A3G2T9_9STRA|nr:hypothetical protein PF009_g2132 [Phytophthora fragariae]KAE8998623.1 hypothetical protein PF011_g14970 [Phytophthora fragariae]KAE9227072.1 hypothetical protein PF002_g13935 [Phytophthora fragariae]